MEQVRRYLQRLLENSERPIANAREEIIAQFCVQQRSNVKQIFDLQEMIKKDWNLFTRLADLEEQRLMLPNGTVQKAYHYQLDFEQLQLTDFRIIKFNDLEAVGLHYDETEKAIKGLPTHSGDFAITISFQLDIEQAEDPLHQKVIKLIINPDPKSLWKNVPIDPNLPYSKPDEAHVQDSFLDKKIVIASKRGRSHANSGAAREDHFAYKNYENSEWSIIAVADGAGSATYARQASKIVCEHMISYFEAYFGTEPFKTLNELLGRFKMLNAKEKFDCTELYQQILGNAALATAAQLELFATENGIAQKELHTTLIFSLVRKYEFGYAILSFSVGDCPIAVLNTDETEVSLLNQLDVGEFSGGTRFITMPEIFSSTKFSERITIKIIDDFSYLMLMTDGIYDPKFTTEANLEKIEKWKELLADLNGGNEDGAAVNFAKDNDQIAMQLAKWMDFWSSGNHDDRTLAIIY